MVAEEKTSWLAPFSKNYVVVTVFLLVVMVLGYAGIVYGGASQITLWLILKGGYSAGFIFAMTAWAGVIGTVIYLLNAFIGDRLERRWAQLIGAVAFAGGWLVMYKQVHSSVAVYIGYLADDCRRDAVAVEHVRVHPQLLPDPDAGAGHRLDRRYRPPRRLGRRPDRRSALQHHRAEQLLHIRHDPVRAAPGILIAVLGKNQRHRALEELSR